MIKLDRSYFQQIDTLMQEAFPCDERRTSNQQLALFDRVEYEVYGIVENQRVLAFLAVWDLGDFIFGEHLATDASMRGSGIGKQLLLEYLLETNKPMILEVEHPETAMAKRRIGFYQRLGFHLYDDVLYAQPSFHGKEALPLHLMSYPSRLTPMQLQMAIKHLYHIVYGEEYKC